MNEFGVFTFLTAVCRHQTEKTQRETRGGMSNGFLVNRRKYKSCQVLGISKILVQPALCSIENNFLGVKRGGGGEPHKTLFVQLSLSLFEWSH